MIRLRPKNADQKQSVSKPKLTSFASNSKIEYPKLTTRHYIASLEAKLASLDSQASSATGGFALLEADCDGKVIHASATCARLLEKTNDALVGHPLEALGIVIPDSRGHFATPLVSVEQVPQDCVGILGVLVNNEDTLLEILRESGGNGREHLILRDAAQLMLQTRRSMLRSALRNAWESRETPSLCLTKLIQTILSEFAADHAWIWETTESGRMLLPRSRVEAISTRYPLPAFDHGELVSTALALAEPVIDANGDVVRFKTTPPNCPDKSLCHDYLGAMLRFSDSEIAVLMLERCADSPPWQNADSALLRESIDLISLGFHSLHLREKVEERATYFRNVFQSTDIGVLVLSCTPKGYRVSLFNERFCTLFRVTQEEFEPTNEEGIAELLGSHLGNKQLILELFKDPEREHTGEFVIKGNTPRVLQVFSRAATDSAGDPFGRLFLFRDITRDKELEQQLLHSQKMESIGTLAGGIAHDFNNLLTSMLGYSDLLKRDIPVENPLRERVDQIERAARRAADLTMNLLAFSRRTPTQMEVLDVSSFIKKTMSILRFSVPSSIEMRLELEEDLPCIEGDETQLEQVLINLVINAKDALPDNKGLITITARRGSDSQKTPGSNPGDFVVVEVDDNGIGISQEDLGRIFEPFYTTKGVGRGTGLGLSTVYGIVKQHNGFIEVTSAPSLGSTFSFYIPATSKKPPTSNTASVTPETPPKEKRHARILVVDDEPDLLAFCVTGLEETCDHVLTASNGLEAVAVIEEAGDSIDLVILDLTMPRMGGLEAYRRIRRMHPKMRIVITSGYSLEPGASDLLDEGAVVFLQKPYTLADLQRVVEQCLN